MKQIFQDKDGNLSSKRIAGIATLIIAIVFTAIEIGDVELVKVMFIGGFAAVGITAFEKKSL
jgi:spore germination protein GerM